MNTSNCYCDYFFIVIEGNYIVEENLNFTKIFPQQVQGQIMNRKAHGGVET